MLQGIIGGFGPLGSPLGSAAAQPSFDVDFASLGSSAASYLSTTRSTAARATQSNGDVSSFAVDTPRFGAAGNVIEQAGGNLIPNAAWSGAVVGNMSASLGPVVGAFPTGTNFVVAGGAVASRVAFGVTAAGSTYAGTLPGFTWRWAFTNTAATFTTIYFMCGTDATTNNQAIAAAAGSSVTASILSRLAAGSLANLTTWSVALAEYNSSGTYLRETSLVNASTITATLTRYSRTVTLGANTAYVAIIKTMVVPASTTWDWTVDLVNPMIETVDVLDEPTTIASRAADRVTVPSVSVNTASASLLLRATAPGGAAEAVGVQSDDATANNRLRLVRNTSGECHLIVTAGGSDQADINLGSWTAGSETQVAVAVTTGEVRASRMGRPVVSASVAVSPGNLANTRLGQTTSAPAGPMTIGRLAKWNSALSDGQLVSRSLAPALASIWAEGDSGMDGAYGFALKTSLQSAGKTVTSTAAGGATIDDIKTRVLARYDLRRRIFVLWDMSINSYGTVSGYVAKYADIVAWLAPYDRFLIVSPYRYFSMSTQEKADVLLIQAALSSAYGTKYIDAQAIAVAAGDPVADAADIAANYVPRSLLNADGIHPGSAVLHDLNAAAIVSRIASLGWT